MINALNEKLEKYFERLEKRTVSSKPKKS